MQRNFVTDCHLHWKTKFEPKLNLNGRLTNIEAAKKRCLSQLDCVFFSAKEHSLLTKSGWLHHSIRFPTDERERKGRRVLVIVLVLVLVLSGAFTLAERIRNSPLTHHTLSRPSFIRFHKKSLK